jgi:hypothetical protein
MKDRSIIKVQDRKRPDSQQFDASRSVVEVFKTNVEHEKEAKELVDMLRERFPGSRVNFDLQDCDRILRVEGKKVCVDAILGLMETEGFTCTVLD